MNPKEWVRVKEIFHQALALPPVERADFVDKETAGESDVALEVRALLDAHSESETFIGSPAFRPIGSLIDDAGMATRVGQTIGSYRIERRIGHGGMGTVFLASRADSEFDKNVAIKLIKRGFDTDEIVKRFKHERQILATLDHPNITRLLDGGSTDDGLPYLVMDYVDGKTLTRFCNERELSLGERLNIFLQICEAVAYAHRNLVIHRDLKPSNIFVTADGVPKLLDFGIAKLMSTGDQETVDTRRAAFHALTPEYASPEQITGGSITTASDIYSLGIVLYELLTGHRPKVIEGNGPERIGHAVNTISPTKPSSICRSQGLKVATVNPAMLVRSLQGDLDNIILMAIRQESSRRYSSVEQFSEDIRRYLNGLPVIAREDTIAYRTSKFVSRNKAGVAAGLGIAASLLGGLIAAQRQARVAARQRDRARLEAEKAEKVNKFLQRMLASADPRVAGRDVRVIEMLKMAAEAVEHEFAQQPEIAADVSTTIGITYLSLGQLVEAERHLESALRLREESLTSNAVELATSEANLARVLQAKGELSQAEEILSHALSMIRSSAGSNGLAAAEVLEHLSYVVALRGDNDTAIELASECLQIRLEMLGPSHLEVGKSYFKLASLYSLIGRHDLAESLHRRAWAILRNVYGVEHPDIAQLLHNLVRDVLPTRPDEAEELARTALSMRLRLLGDRHPDVAWSWYNLAYVLIMRENFMEAETSVQRALELRGEDLPDENPLVASCFLLLGRSQMASGRLREALRSFKTCYSLREKTLLPDNWLLSTTRSFIGECLFRLGYVEAGCSMLSESFSEIRTKLGPAHEQTKQALQRMKDLGLRAK